jgi:Uma2 family endonuclease
MSPSPLTIHQRVLREIVVRMHAHAKTQDLGEVFFAPFDVHLPLRATVVEPDIVFVKAGQAEIIGKRGVRGVPALLVEILSPSTKWVDLGAKRGAFAQSGVPEYWIVDPVSRTITVHIGATVDAEAADASGGREVEGGDFGAAWEYGVGEHAMSRVIAGFGVPVDEVIPAE